MKAKFLELQTESEGKVDITPMLDVVFILLIFFIVTATFINEKGIDLTPPPIDVVNSQPKPALLISISENDRIFIANREVDPRRVAANVKRLTSENPELAVVIQASKQSKNNTFVKVLDEVRVAGFMNPTLAPSTL